MAIDGAGHMTGDGTVLGSPTWTLGDQYYFNASSAGPHTVHKATRFEFFFDLVGDSTDPIPPATATWISNEVPSPAADGVLVTFSTRWPYVDGSLQVWVDNTEQTAAITSEDGIAGTFTLAFAPTSTERLRVRYQSR
jgi:hypothetical protein